MDRFSARRSATVFVCVGVAFALLIFRVTWLQTIGRRQTISKADRQQHQTVTLESRRGGIFDRNGFALALTIQKQDLFADPHFMMQVLGQDGLALDEVVLKLSKVLECDAIDLSQKLAASANSRFIILAQDLDESRIEEIQKLRIPIPGAGMAPIPGIGIAPSSTRSYPMGSLAAHILGGVGRDGKGSEGIEAKFNELLSGKDGWERKLKDAKRRAIGVAADDYLPPQHGQHLILTIDANIQMIAEQELAATCKNFDARRGEVVVMDPNTGEVLALANYPTYDPNDIENASLDLRRNRSLTDPYEPGSTIKPFIVGPALEWNQTNLLEEWKIPGLRFHTYYGRTITDTHYYGNLRTWDVLVKSSNIGMSQLGERMGNPLLHRALASWGYGRPTGIELPAENGGKLSPLKKWTKYSTESTSQGYEIMVTPMQLCRAFCAYANGGRLVDPSLIRGVLASDGRLISRRKPTQLDVLPQVVDPEVAAEIRRVLCDVVVRGTAAPEGRSDTWNIFGKTGTAHISNGKSGYSLTKFNSSFVCAAPAENPRLVVAFVVHEPGSKVHFGGQVSSPGAKNLLERALTYLQIPPSPELSPPPPQIATLLNNCNPQAYKRKAEKLETADAAAVNGERDERHEFRYNSPGQTA